MTRHDGATESAATRSSKLRAFYARFVTGRGAAADPRIEQAFAAVPREPFAGPPPWFVLSFAPGSIHRRPRQYLETPDDDPAFLYQDTLIALDPARGINIGEPSLHARCLDALSVRPGAKVLHIGAGSGYYTAILAELAGPQGEVIAFEIAADLAARAQVNLVPWPWARVEARSGIAADLPKAHAIYVNAGITQPMEAWLDALLPEGKLLFPLQPEGGLGGMLLVRRPTEDHGAWPARFASRAAFIGCQGEQSARAGRALADAFAAGGWEAVRSLRRNDAPDESCWVRGAGWWLSTRPAPDAAALPG
jgi:protein-L-isoaspartate(D-aspartate) O-methyltransferase